MFRRPSDVRGKQRLSGADRKKLRRNIRDKFPGTTDEQLEAILPAKADVAVTRLVNRVLVYGLENGLPMLFDCDGRGNEIYHTVFALWRVPDLLPSFLLTGEDVSRYLLSGADLMAPGVQVPIEGLPAFQKGEVWSVKVPGNSCPVAVGITMLGREEVIQAGVRGKLFRITHSYRDSLCSSEYRCENLWESAKGSYVPNKGFLPDMVASDPDAQPTLLDAPPAVAPDSPEGSPEDYSGAAAGCRGEGEGRSDWEVGAAAVAREGLSAVAAASGGEGAASGGKRATAEAAAGAEGAAEGAVARDSSERLSESLQEQEGDKKAAGAGEKCSPAAAPSALMPAQMDELLDLCLLQALSVSVKPSHLPLSASSLWANHVLPCRPPGTTMDIKKSSHKKLSKWLHAKAVDGLICGKEDKHRKEFIISSVNHRHQSLLAFWPYKTAQAPPRTAPQGSLGIATESATVTATTTVEELFKPSPHVAPVFESVGLDPHAFYSPSAVRNAALSYISLHSLSEPSNPSIVVLDATLCDALYKANAGATQGGEGGRSVERKGELEPVEIFVRGRQGSRRVTRVTGVEAYPVEAEPLAAELQKKFASGASVAQLPGKKGQHEVYIQGGFLDKLSRLLVDVHGIPKSYVTANDYTRR
ncbi:unnamed protein product [Closterium sp. Yama58-4]|nr:unnamed protein product [Closterium sp. Yama58-4]